MNHIHRLIFNASSNTWVAVAENARGRGKGSSRKLVAAALSLAVSLAQAAPLGGTVASGTGSISQAGSATTILQTTPSLTLNWKSFNIGAAESVKFVQPSASSVAVNRIYDINGSQILGRLSANGQVYLINPNGILFGKDAQVNVAGLHASTQTLNNTGTGSATPYGPGSIFNHGTLTALNGGFVTLQADTVTNTGLISAQTLGTQTGTIKLLGNMKTGSVTQNGTLDASAPNGGNGGFIETSAASVKIGNAAQVTTFATRGTTGTWLIDPPDFTIAATGGDITGLQLSTLLNKNSIQIQSSSGTVNTAGNGDINVNDGVSWSANTLTLTATNNININANMTGSGTAKLALEYGQGSTIPSATNVNTGTYTLKLLETWPGGSSTLPNTFQAVVSLPAGKNFSTRLGSDGLPTVYTVITDLGLATDVASPPLATTLQSLAALSNMGGNFVLGSNIDAASTKNWNVIASVPWGFTPIGDTTNRFSGVLDGLGHTISNLYINMGSQPDAGLFGMIVTNPLIQNIGLLGGSVSGGAQTGGLVGNKQGGLVRNTFNTGTVTGGAGTGGLVGQNTLGDIIYSYSSGPVNGAAYTGGLVGSAGVGSVRYSYATGDVVGLIPVPSLGLVRIGSAGVGGLVGTITTGSVDHSFASGNVSGAASTGGLVGTITTGVVSNTYATGNVTGGAGTGGLVGNSTGLVELSFAVGNVTSTIEGVPGALGGAGAGGLIGQTTGSVNRSYATGNVSGDAGVGGLVGNATDKLINNVYATGTVTGNSIVGGLLGSSTGPLTNSYSTGLVSGVDGMTTGGLVGAPTGIIITNNFFNSQVNPSLAGGGSLGIVGGITGLSTVGMTTVLPFVTATWDAPTTWTLTPGVNPLLTELIGLGVKKATAKPTEAPTSAPTAGPTASPSVPPTAIPTSSPTASPTAGPTASPSATPTAAPSSAPTASPTAGPIVAPSVTPTAAPTSSPTASPIASPTSPTSSPTPAASSTPIPGVNPTGAMPLSTTPRTPGKPVTTEPEATATTPIKSTTPTAEKETGGNVQSFSLAGIICLAPSSTSVQTQIAKVVEKVEKKLPESGRCSVENIPVTLFRKPLE